MRSMFIDIACNKMQLIGLIGYGYWGEKLSRCFGLNKQCKLISICDKDNSRLNAANDKFPGVSLYNNYDLMLDSEHSMNALVIATPPSTHFEIARSAILKNINILVEKTFTTSTDDAKKLVSLSDNNKVNICIDYTFLYNSNIIKMKKLITNKLIGDVKQIHFKRKVGRYRDDVSVIFDLASHDFSIIDYLFGLHNKTIEIHVTKHNNYGFEQISSAIIRLNLIDDGIKSYHDVEWFGEQKVRSILVIGTTGGLLLENKDNKEQLTYIKGNSDQFINNETFNRLSDITTPIFIQKQNEALINLSVDFINSINNQKKPLADKYLGIRVLDLIQDCHQSIRLKRKVVKNYFNCGEAEGM